MPLWDRKTESGRKRYWVTFLGVFVIMFIIVLSIIAYWA
jgi:hypothetical protein